MALTGSVVSVEFLGGFPAAFRRVQVRGAHWESRLAARITDGEGGSRRPAVFQVGRQVRAEVVVEITGAGAAGGPATLQAELGGLRLRGSFMLADGLIPVSVTATLGDSMGRHEGEVVWSITAPPLQAPLALGNATRLEVFAVLAPPEPFFADGVWAEALRLLMLEVGLAGVRDSRTALRLITRHCHGSLGLVYDSAKALNHYGVEHSGGKFNLLKLLDSNSRVRLASCFDLVAAVLVLGGAVGIPARWLTAPIQPTRPRFGFILETDLMGIGNCNNPFFRKNHTAQVIGRTDAGRTAFGMHGFCESLETIFDACIGPHVGMADRDNYLRATADGMNHLGLSIPEIGHIGESPSPILELV